MNWFDKDEIEATGSATQSITSGIRQMFTGEIPPEIIKEMDKLDSEHVTRRWEADNKLPWYLSSRAIVLLLLNFNLVVMLWFNTDLAEYWVTTYTSLLMLVNGAFFGSKGIEFIRAGKAP
jgi:hypothetical protein